MLGETGVLLHNPFPKPFHFKESDLGHLIKFLSWKALRKFSKQTAVEDSDHPKMKKLSFLSWKVMDKIEEKKG